MTDPHRMINPESRDYRLGAQAARQALDGSTGSAADLLAGGEHSAAWAHEQEKTGDYLYARGFVDTIRDYIDERSS